MKGIMDATGPDLTARRICQSDGPAAGLPVKICIVTRAPGEYHLRMEEVAKLAEGAGGLTFFNLRHLAQQRVAITLQLLKAIKERPYIRDLFAIENLTCISYDIPILAMNQLNRILTEVRERPREGRGFEEEKVTFDLSRFREGRRPVLNDPAFLLDLFVEEKIA